MHRSSPIVPSYRIHKSTGQAVVTIGGRDRYLGKHGSNESRAEYDRLVAEWLSTGRRSTAKVADFTVAELLVGYFEFAALHYRRLDGTPTSEIDCIKLATRPLRELYAHVTVAEFGPLALKAVRQRMVDAGLVRTSINQHIQRICRVFRWGVENELVDVGIYQSLRAVSGLRAGRTEAVESNPIGPVPDSFVDAVRDFVAPQIWTMIQLQRLTAMRPGEVCRMTTGAIDRGDKVWIYRPSHHKTIHHRKARSIFLGPRAQAILLPILSADPHAPIFSPREAMAAFRNRHHANRRTPLSCGNRPGTNRRPNPKKRPGVAYTVGSYRQAIERACDKATEANVRRYMQQHCLTKALDPEDVPQNLIVPRWSPNGLRHLAATALRRAFGIETAKTILGHSALSTTEIYAERDLTRAAEAALMVG